VPGAVGQGLLDPERFLLAERGHALVQGLHRVYAVCQRGRGGGVGSSFRLRHHHS
jgi:hypothetical protein